MKRLWVKVTPIISDSISFWDFKAGPESQRTCVFKCPSMYSLNLISKSRFEKIIRTMVCMSDEIRYSWMHAVFPEHIRGRRIALTMREPSAAFKVMHQKMYEI